MSRERKLEVVEEVVTYKCDVCGKSIIDTGNMEALWTLREIRSCEICGRDVCTDCGQYSYNFNGVYCQDCWDIGEEYREAILKLRDGLYGRELDLRRNWKIRMKEALNVEKV